MMVTTLTAALRKCSLPVMPLLPQCSHRGCWGRGISSYRSARATEQEHSLNNKSKQTKEPNKPALFPFLSSAPPSCIYLATNSREPDSCTSLGFQKGVLKLFLLFDFFFFWYGFLLCSPGWPESHCVAQAGIEFPGDSPASAKSRDYSHVLL